MNHLYNDTVLRTAIKGYFHDTFNFDADYFYVDHKIVWVHDFLEESGDHLFMNILPHDVISKITAFYRKNDFFDASTSHQLFKIGGAFNGLLTCDNKERDAYGQPLVQWKHAFGIDIIGKFVKKHWKIKLVANIEQIAIGIIGIREQQKLLNRMNGSVMNVSRMRMKETLFLNKEFDGIGIESRWNPNSVNDDQKNDWESYKKHRDKRYGSEFREWTKRKPYSDYLRIGDVIEFILDLSKINDYMLQFIVNGQDRGIIKSTMLNCDTNKKYKLAIATRNVYNVNKPTQVMLLQ